MRRVRWRGLNDRQRMPTLWSSDRRYRPSRSGHYYSQSHQGQHQAEVELCRWRVRFAGVGFHFAHLGGSNILYGCRSIPIWRFRNLAVGLRQQKVCLVRVFRLRGQAFEWSGEGLPALQRFVQVSQRRLPWPTRGTLALYLPDKVV